MPSVKWFVGLTTAAGTMSAAWLHGGWGGERTVALVNLVSIAGFAMLAAVCAGLAAHRSRGRHRLAWASLAVGLTGLALGECIWAYFDLVRHTDPFPSIADAAYLLYPVGACVALLLLSGGQTGQNRLRMVLDGLIMAGALFEISWVTGMRAVFEARGENVFETALSLAYPASDIVVVTVALLMLTRSRRGNRMTLSLLTLGNVLNALSDTGWVYLDSQDAYTTGGIVDMGWIAGLLFLSIAGFVGWRTATNFDEPRRAPSRAEIWMPYLPVGVAAAVCTPWILAMPGMTPLLVSSTLLISAVLARQFLVVGENRRLLAIVAERALRDPLTGLANRVLFRDRLSHAMELHQRDDQSVAVLSVDLDDFKLVNDSLGHPAGDALLIKVADRISGCVRGVDTAARLGGDEFAVLVEGMPDDARLIAFSVVRAFDQPFVIDGHELTIGASVGLALATADDLGLSTDALLKRADTAMYSAKRSRSGVVHTFTPEMDPIARRGPDRDGGVRMLAELRRAIDGMELALVYQPKFDLRSSAVVGVEALLRWPHPSLGVLVPDHFLPLVHRHGLVTSVTELVLARALDDTADWLAHGHRVPIAVNISAPSLGDLNLPNRIKQALNDRHLSADLLTVEITEDLLVDNIDRARIVLNNLREYGIRVAIDDFGAGYSALSYLRDLPVDEVKLDRQFVAPILNDVRAAAIVRAVIDLAHVLGMTTVAEGIEDDATAVRLAEYGCEIVQGFYCSPPVGAGAILDMLRDRQQCCTDLEAATTGSFEIPLVPSRSTR
jgi:diguanylate cyclase (GGDEF)-like protein